MVNDNTMPLSVRRAVSHHLKIQYGECIPGNYETIETVLFTL